MQVFLDYAKVHEYFKITGWLSPVDGDLFDPLEHFYKKFGFVVEFQSNRTEGIISLEMLLKFVL